MLWICADAQGKERIAISAKKTTSWPAGESTKMINQIEKECRIHGFASHNLRSDGSGRQSYKCTKCRNSQKKDRRRTFKLKAVEYKGGSCNSCGYNRCIEALEFHHVEPGLKDFEISSKAAARSWADVTAELDKCLMVCANCHREIHKQNR